MTDTSATAESDWVPTPSGQLDQLARGLRQARRNHNAKRLAAGLLVVLVTLFVAQRTMSTRPLACDTTRSYAKAFLNDSLAANTKKRVKKHLASCPSCQKYYAAQEDRNLTAMAE